MQGYVFIYKKVVLLLPKIFIMLKNDKMPHGIDYNSDKDDLIFPEYGRNIQAMILFAKAEKDLEKRQLMVESIVNLMYMMNPQSKNVDDYKEKLWKHVFRIADYNMGGVLPPSGIHPVIEDVIKRPEPLNYPPSGTKFRHYGNNIHTLIKKAQEMPEGALREGMIGTIGAYMKLAYRTWNKEHFVSDDLIKDDLETLSNGTLEFEEGQRIDRLAAASKRRKPEEITTGGGRYNNGYDNRGRNNDSRGGDNRGRGDNRNNNGDNRGRSGGDSRNNGNGNNRFDNNRNSNDNRGRNNDNRNNNNRFDNNRNDRNKR
jgi:Domain of unknown function (DUF4290)